MIIDTTNDELLINGQRWQRGGYLQATAYGTEQINITARDGRVIGKALQWDAIYDEDKNLFGLNRDGVVTALTAVFDSRVKSPYNLEALRDVQDGTASYGDTLIWSAPGEWQYDTLTQYHHAYNSEAATLRAGATATTELYYTAQADGDGLSESAQSNTPAEGYQIVRKLYYAEAAQADPDTGTWVQFADLDPNTTYASAKATLLAYLKERTGGTVPISLKMTWEEVEEFDGLLDTYGGAAAAYSVRRLSSSYTGSLIQVERASDNTTQDIGYDSNGDLDTAAIATFCSGTTCGVRVWYDQSGNGNDATQTTFANQPTIYTGGAVVTENAKPAVQFDGTDDGLNCSTDLRATTGASTVIMTRNVDMKSGGDVQNVFVFHKVQRHVIEKSGSTNYDEISISTNETANEFIKFPSTDLTGQHLFFSTWDGTTQNGTVDDVVLYYDATVQSQTIGSGAFATTASGTNSIGYRHDTNTQFCDGTIQEVIVYLTDESSNRSGIETNVNDYFGIYTPFTTGLLDDYGGAAAAYSLRRLSSTYTGDAIRVRRASDNAEQDIGFDIEGNLNTAALASFCSGTNGFVKTWYCQSGNANDATQTTTGSQPKVYDSGTGTVTVGTKPGLSFATNNIFSLTSQISITNENFFYVTGNIVDVSVYIASSSYVRNQAFRYLLYDGSSFYASNISPASGYSLQTVINNDGVYQNTSKLANFTNKLTVAGTSILKANAAGSYQELIIYDADQSSNRSGIETNINDFYSIY